MQFYPIYRQDDQTEIESLVHSQKSCNLLTVSPKGAVHNGIFNHHYGDGRFLLHLNKTDEQIADLKARPTALVAVQELFCLIPSYWVDADYGGAATMYYRYVEFDCEAVVEQNAEKMLFPLQSLMDRYQPEKGYKPLNASDPVYQPSLSMLALVTLTPVATRTKWKLGQNRPAEVRRRVVDELRKRGTAGDLRAAEEVERWLTARGK